MSYGKIYYPCSYMCIVSYITMMAPKAYNNSSKYIPSVNQAKILLHGQKNMNHPCTFVYVVTYV